VTSLTIDGFETYILTELGLSQETLSAYTRDVKEFLCFIGNKQLTAKLIEEFVSSLHQRGLKSTSVRRKYMSIRCFCNHLISLGKLDKNILGMTDSVRIEKGTFDVLESQAVDALVATVENRVPVLRATNVRRDVAIILTMYHSGLRVSELCSLDVCDINFARREMKVKGKGFCERIVPTTSRCIEAIKEYIDLERKSTSNAVFVKGDGQRISRRAVSGMLLSLSRRAGVKHTTSHTLRRSCATSLMDRGVDLELIQVLLGHKHLSTTQTYLVTSPEKLKLLHKRCHPFGEINAV